jgi:cell division protein FtsA
MAKAEIVAGIDLGSHQITCVIAERDFSIEAVNVKGASRQPCRGLKGGVVINIDETALAVTRAVEEAEKMAGAAVRSVVIGLRGPHVQTFNHHGAINIARTDKEITAEDVSQVIEATKAVPISADREIIHVIPQDFVLDRQDGVPNPVGMEGSLLEVEVHIVTASTNHLNNIWRTISNAGFQVEEPIYGLLAVADAVVTEEEKELGCVLVDIGGQTTGLAVYTEGRVRFTKELAVGSDTITFDLSHGLRASQAQARVVKERHGAASREFAANGHDEEIVYTGVDGRTPRRVKRAVLYDYISPRVEEIFSMVGAELQNSGFIEGVGAGGMILTGGGSQLNGLVPAVEQILEIPARLGLVQGAAGTVEILNDPSYATAIGLLTYKHLGEWTRSHRAAQRVPVSRKLRQWWGGLF